LFLFYWHQCQVISLEWYYLSVLSQPWVWKICEECGWGFHKMICSVTSYKCYVDKFNKRTFVNIFIVNVIQIHFYLTQNIYSSGKRFWILSFWLMRWKLWNFLFCRYLKNFYSKINFEVVSFTEFIVFKKINRV
jgi:hypothetical protein